MTKLKPENKKTNTKTRIEKNTTDIGNRKEPIPGANKTIQNPTNVLKVRTLCFFWPWVAVLIHNKNPLCFHLFSPDGRPV